MVQFLQAVRANKVLVHGHKHAKMDRNTWTHAWTDYDRRTEITVVPSNVVLSLRHTLRESSSVLGLASVLSPPPWTLPLN